MTVEDYYMMKLTTSKYTESEFEVFNAIDVNGLNRIVHKLENKNGTREEITVKIMKKVVAVADTKICHVLNKSLEEGIFLSDWKEATVVPILKVRGTKKVEEFRPINKLPIYEKILEIIVHSQLIDYLENNNLLEECQSGFEQGIHVRLTMGYIKLEEKYRRGKNGRSCIARFKKSIGISG